MCVGEPAQAVALIDAKLSFAPRQPRPDVAMVRAEQTRLGPHGFPIECDRRNWSPSRSTSPIRTAGRLRGHPMVPPMRR